MDACGWEYRVVVFKIADDASFQDRLNDFGIAGWELVTLSSTVKTRVNGSGTDLIAVLKRPSDERADRSHVPRVISSAAWYPDPRKRYEQRWWDGAQWTDIVSDGRKQSRDPLPPM